MKNKAVEKAPTLGVDLGGTKVETSLIDATGKILASHWSPTEPEKGPDGVIANIIECVNTIRFLAVNMVQQALPSMRDWG